MYEELGRLLEGRASPELTEALVALDGTLFRAGFTMHREEIDYLLSNEASIDGGEMLLNVAAILRTGGNRVLDLFEVEVSDEMPWPMLISLVHALASFGPSDNYEDLDAIIKDSASSDETFCDLLEHLTEFSAIEYLPYIVKVSDNLIKTFEEKIDSFLQTQERPDDISSNVRERINLYRRAKNNEFADRLDQDGISVGTSMESLYTQYTDHLLSISVEGAVKDLLYMSLYSGLDEEAIGDEASHYIEDLYPDVENNQRANISLRRELAALESLLKQDD
jgi:hypothetical protein